MEISPLIRFWDREPSSLNIHVLTSFTFLTNYPNFICENYIDSI